MAEMRTKWTAGILVVNDRAFVGKLKNRTGPVLQEFLERRGYRVSQPVIIPYDKQEIVSILNRCVYRDRLHFILVSGGIGLSPLDVTPEAILEVVERRFPGMEEALRKGFEANRVEAMLFQGIVGTAGNSLIVALPQEMETARECLKRIEPAIDHALHQISGEKTDP